MDTSHRAAVSFSDVAAMFSEEEWDVLEEWQRDLYGNVMREIHHVLLDLGYRIENSEVLFRITREEETSKLGRCQEGLRPDIMLRINYQGAGPEQWEESDKRVITMESDILPGIKEEDVCDTGAPDPTQGQDMRPCSTPGLAVDPLYPMIIKKEAEDGGALQQSEPTGAQTACKSLCGGEAAPEQDCRGRTRRRKGIARQIKSIAALHDCDQNQQTEPKEKEAPQHPRLMEDIYPFSFQQRGQTFIICSVCGKTFCNNSSFRVHMRTHTGERPYKCSHCDKSFIRSSHLKIHLRTHTGERPYQCPQCDKSFRDNSSFARHQRIHTGEKPYQCATCGKDFRKKSNLKDHQRTHTGERPYKCKHCDKSFHQRSNLRVHERNHHRQNAA